jgi:hypothetical protein
MGMFMMGSTGIIRNMGRGNILRGKKCFRGNGNMGYGMVRVFWLIRMGILLRDIGLKGRVIIVEFWLFFLMIMLNNILDNLYVFNIEKDLGNIIY